MSELATLMMTLMMLSTDEQVVCCHLSSIQSSLYKSLVNSKSTQNALSKVGSGKITASSLSSIMHLKKLCNRMSAFSDTQTCRLLTLGLHRISYLAPAEIRPNFMRPGMRSDLTIFRCVCLTV